MTYDECVDRTIQIIRELHDLKEDVLYSEGLSVQREFDAGMLEGASTILCANVDQDDPRYKAEIERQCNARLLRAR